MSDSDIKIDTEVETENDAIDDKILLLNNNKIKSSGRKNDKLKNAVIFILSCLVVLSIYCISLRSENNSQLIKSGKYNSGEMHELDEIYELNGNNIFNNSTAEKPPVQGFEFVDPENPKGPITVDLKRDDGTKIDYTKLINPEDDSFYYKYDEFDKLDYKILDLEEYLCELGTGSPPEAYKGYEISCPSHYTITIDNVFYGRHANDTKHCNTYYEGNSVEEEMLTTKKECGDSQIRNVKELCDGKVTCFVRPGGSHFTDSCPGKFKYLHVNYHCVKDKKLKKERISIVMFSNIVKVNSIYENAISSFYQYSQIHGYEFQFNHYRYDTERQVFFMKLNSVLEKIMVGLKMKKYDWVFWVDSDVILANPNIKLEAFLPNEKMNNIHLIAANDVNGFNAGVFLIRVHPWSLNFSMRAMSYSYYNNKLGQGLKYADQSSMNNVLIEGEESDHYVIVPQTWFNSYIGLNTKGEFLLHLAGHVKKDEEAKEFREHISQDKEWYKKSSAKMRKEVLEYYDLPKEKQNKISHEFS